MRTCVGEAETGVEIRTSSLWRVQGRQGIEAESHARRVRRHVSRRRHQHWDLLVGRVGRSQPQALQSACRIHDVCHIRRTP